MKEDDDDSRSKFYKAKLETAKQMGEMHYEETAKEVKQQYINNLNIDTDEDEHSYTAKRKKFKNFKEADDYTKKQDEKERASLLPEPQARDKVESASIGPPAAPVEYEKFNNVESKLLSSQRADNDNLSSVTQIMKSGADISPEMQKSILKSPKQISETKNDWETAQKAFKTAQEKKKYTKKQIDKIDHSFSSASPSEQLKLIETKKSLQSELNDSKEIINKFNNTKDQRNKEAHLIQKMEKYAKKNPNYQKILDEKTKAFKEVYGKTPDKVEGQQKGNVFKKVESMKHNLTEHSNIKQTSASTPPIGLGKTAAKSLTIKK